MDLNRRTFIAGVSALTTTPAFSFTLPKKEHPQIKIIKEHFTNYLKWDCRYDVDNFPSYKEKPLTDIHLATEKICHRMVDIRPERFIDRVLSAPTARTTWPNIDGLPVEMYEFHHICSVSRSYNIELQQEEIWDTDRIANELLNELDYRDEIVKKIWKNRIDLYQSYPWLTKEQVDRLTTVPPIYMTYMVAVPIRCVKPDDFSPRVCFKIRGNYTFGNSRIQRIPDDLRIEVKQWKIEDYKWDK